MASKCKCTNPACDVEVNNSEGQTIGCAYMSMYVLSCPLDIPTTVIRSPNNCPLDPPPPNQQLKYSLVRPPTNCLRPDYRGR